MNILQIVQQFDKNDLVEQAKNLFKILGYEGERGLDQFSQQPEAFLNQFDVNKRFQKHLGHFEDLKRIALLFQYTDADVQKALEVKQLFESKGKFDNSIIESYLFIALELKENNYSRTVYAEITRQLNKIFDMPALVLFKSGNHLTLSMVHRRLHKKDEQKDVLEKVTLLKDISIQKPHRAHLDILSDLAFENFKTKPKNFVELHKLWQTVLDIKELNKKFYKELSQWYFWAIKQVSFPNPENIELNQYHAQSLIRLLTRLLFVWFIKEKKLIPEALFIETEINKLLKTEDQSGYYKAILQNLFFATLNQTRGKRAFRKDKQQMNITNLMRYQHYFKNPEMFITLLEEKVPFMNGGLFECLDKPIPDKKGKQGGDVIAYYDGFSDREDNVLNVPNKIFFGEHSNIDLSAELGTKNKSLKIKGLIDILNAYKFTVAENTPIEEDVALDPELLGQVFENLLASYNPETGTTARKQTGSFYTPREIVDYMVDESLIAYFSTLKLEENKLRNLLNYNDSINPFNQEDTKQLINAIDQCKMLDPACGSGAFPMGILHKLVFILTKLDPENKKWRSLQENKAVEETRAAFQIGNHQERDNALKEISDTFDNNASDYGRKLYLIENCIYGVDIQAIAIQISKLRFFISLMIEQSIDPKKDNFGVRPLPNLETKFVAANTLIGIEKPKAQSSIFENKEIQNLEENLKLIRHKIFSAKTPSTKRELREQDKVLREKIGQLLEQHGFEHQAAVQLAQWNPYDQNMSAGFFDPEWMFGISNGFDIVIGNPPYLNIKFQTSDTREYLAANYKYSRGADIYVAFIEKSLLLLNKNSRLAFIVPNKFFGADYGKSIRSYLKNGDVSVSSIWDLKDEKVFETAAISTIVILIQNYKHSESIKLIQNNLEQSIASDDLFDEHGKIQIEASGDDNHILNLMKRYEPLSTLADVRTGIMGFDYWEMKKIISSGERDNAVRIYTNGNLSKYQDLWSSKEIKLYKDKYVRPVIELNELFLNKNTINLFKSKPKIIVRGVSKEIAAIIDYEGSGLLVAVHSIIPRLVNINYVLALLNSKLLNWFHLNTVYSLRIPQGSLKYPVSFLEDLPIPKLSESDQQPFIELVDKIMEGKKRGIETNHWEREIDLRVYKLYGLSEEEIKIIEGNS